MFMDHICEGLTNFGCRDIRPKQVLCSGLLQRQTLQLRIYLAKSFLIRGQ